MEQAILEQLMKLSNQICKMDEKIDNLRNEMNEKFKKQDDKIEALDKNLRTEIQQLRIDMNAKFKEHDDYLKGLPGMFEDLYFVMNKRYEEFIEKVNKQKNAKAI